MRPAARESRIVPTATDQEPHSGRRDRWIALAEQISEAYGLVLLLTLVTYVVMSLVPDTGIGRAIGAATAGLTCIVALTSSEVPVERVRRVVVIVAITTLVALISVASSTRIVMAFVMGVLSLLLLYTAGTILGRVLRSSEVNFRTILGALATYTMLGLLWGFLYIATDVVQGGDFFGSGPTPDDGSFLFFSYTTLTTTGYGNLVPVGQPGESFAVFEMLTGQIYLVTLVAGLVSLWRPGARMADLDSAAIRRRFRHVTGTSGEDEPDPPA